MQKDQIRVASPRQGGFCPNPIDSSLLLCDFSRRLCLGPIALAAFVFLQTSLRDQQAAIEQLARDIGKVSMCFVLKELTDGVGSRQGRGYLVRRRKCGTEITASIPGHLRMLFEVQPEPFFHLTTEGLPARSGFSRFPTGNPPGDTLSSNVEQVNATHSDLRHAMTSLFNIERKPSGEFPSLAAKYTRGHAHWEGNHLFLVEP